jgi:thiol:disulfide interchange protein DsbA
MNRRRFTLASAAGALAGALAHGPARAQAVEKTFRVIEPPQPVDNPKRIEVIEFFWYGCPHCYDLQPALNAWLKRKPADVEFRHAPAVFRESWIPHTQLYHALEAMNLVDKVHAEVFRAIHEHKLELMELAQIQKWIAKFGVDPKQFADVFLSFGVKARTQRSIQMTRSYGIQGTPSLVVHGRYITSPAAAQGHERAMAVVDQLVAQVRATLPAAPKAAAADKKAK